MNRFCKLFIWMAVLWLSTNGCALAAKAGGGQGKEATPQAPATQEAPTMSIPEITHDFGEVTEGAEVTHDFLIKNTGTGNLQVEQVRPGWGCAVAHFDRAIPPGGEGKVSLKLNLKGYQGVVKKTATVFSNDPKNPKLVLTMQGTVKALIEVRPVNAITFRGTPEQIGEGTIELFASAGQQFRIQKSETNLEGKINYHIDTVEEGKHYRLRVTNQLTQGNYNGFIKVYTDMPSKPDRTLRVSAYIEGDIAVKPQTVLIGKLTAQQPVREAKVIVTSNRGKPFQITKLNYDEKLMEVSQQPVPNEFAYMLEIKPRLDNIPAGGRQQTTLSIETDMSQTDKSNVQVHVLNLVESADAGGSAGRAPKAPAPPAGPNAAGQDEKE